MNVFNRHHSECQQSVMQFIRVPDERPSVSCRILDRSHVERRQVALVFGQCPSQGYRSRAPLPDLVVLVEECVRHRVQYLVTEHGGLRRVAGQYLDPAARYILQDAFESVHVHRLVQGVPHRLEHERMVRHLNVARHGVVLTHHLFREDCGEEIVGSHTQQRRRRLLAVGKAQDSQRPRCVPSPPDGEQRHLQYRLCEYLLHLSQWHVLEDIFKRKRQRRAE